MSVLSFGAPRKQRRALVGGVVAGLMILLASTAPARAQSTEPPPMGSTAQAPSAPVQPLPPASPPPAPPPAAMAPPVYAPPPAVEPYPSAAVQMQAEPVPTHTPLYKKWWFWTAIGAFAVTTVVIIAASSSDGPPKTELGNMAAF